MRALAWFALDHLPGVVAGTLTVAGIVVAAVQAWVA